MVLCPSRRLLVFTELAVLIAAVLMSWSPSGAAGAAGPGARNEFLRRLQRGTETTWWVTSRFHRSTRAGPLDASLERLNRPPDWVSTGFGTVAGRWNGRRFLCSTASGGKVCGADQTRATAQSSVATLRELREATGARGPWRVEFDGSVRIAGLRARCYALTARSKPSRSPAQQHCLTADGIALRTRIRRAGSTDIVTATRVRRSVTDAQIAALLVGYPISGAA